MGTGLKTGMVFSSKSTALYSADAGIEDAIWQIKYEQLKGKFSTYDPHDYSTVWSYSLPQVNGQPQINGKDVDISLNNNWVVKDIEAPDTASGNAIINNNKLIVTGGNFGASSYNIVITYYPGQSEVLKINTVGIWLPPGYTYKANSSNLGFEPATSAFQGGQAVIWTFSAINFTSLPGANPTNSPMTAKITFSYSPSTTTSTSVAAGSTSISVASTTGFPLSGTVSLNGEPFPVKYSGLTATSFTGIPASGNNSITIAHTNAEAVGLGIKPDAVSWINSSNVSGLSYTWDDTVRVFHIVSTCEDTSIDTYVSKSTPRKIGRSQDGDYYATGNSLMRDINSDGVKETRTNSSAIVAAPNPDTADNGIPDDANVSAAYLYWGTWYISESWAAKYSVADSNRCQTLLTDTCDHFTNTSTILKYNGSWSTLTSISSNSLYGVWGSSATVFAVGLDGAIIKYNGTSWSSMTSGTGNTLYSVWGSAATNVYAVGLNGTILTSNGTSWSAMTSGTTNSLYGVWGTSSTNVYAVGLNGTILTYNGTSWSAMTSGTSTTLLAVWGSANNNIFAVGAGGTILKYNGASWSSMTSGTANSLYGVWGSSGTNVFAVGQNGTILKYNGTSWSTLTSNTSRSLYAVWGSSGTNVYAVGLNGTVMKYNGTSWSAVTSGNGGSFYSLWGNSSTNIYVVGSDGNFNNGSDWSVYNTNNYRANGNNDTDSSVNRDLTQNNIFSFDLGAYPSPTWIFTLSWEQWYSGNIPGSTDGLDFYLSGDGGAHWSDPIQAFRGSGVGSSGYTVFATYQYNIPVTYLTDNFKIKFHAVGFNILNQYVNIDDIRINALNPDTGVTFKINNGSGDKIVYYDASGNPLDSSDPANQVSCPQPQVILTYSFGGSNPEFSGFAEACSRDVTSLVTKYSHQPVAPSTNFNGHATYSVIGDLGDTGSNTNAYQLAHAGWSLVTVYTGPETLGHQLYLYDNFFGSGNDSNGIHIVWNGDGTSGGVIKGFVVPQQIEGEINAAKLTCFVTEGDNSLTGDYISMNGTKLWDGKNSTSNSKTSPNNVWNATSYLSGGYTMYDGVDIDTLGIDPTTASPQYITWQSQILKPGDTSATMDLYTKSDYWFMIYMIISFRSETTTGGALSYLIDG